MIGFRTANFSRRPNRRPSRTFFRFLLAYILVLSVPCILAVSLYTGLVRRTEHYVTDRTLSGLRQTQNTVDQYLEQMRWNAIRISENTKLRMMMAAARAGDPISNYEVKQVIDVLFDNVAYQNDLTTTCYVYLKNPSLILTPDTIYNPEYYYKNVVRSQVDGQMLKWHNQISSHYVAGKFYPAMKVQLADPGNRLNVIPFVQSLPAGFKNDPEGYLAYLINADTVRNLLSQVAIVDNGWTCIVDADGEVLTSVGRSTASATRDLPKLVGSSGTEKVDIEGKRMTVMFVTSATSRWKYIASFPATFPRDMIHGIRLATWLSFGFMIFIGLLCAVLFAYRDSRPVDAIFRMMREAFGGQQNATDHRYSSIDRSVSNIIRRSSSLQRSLQMKTDFLQTVFFERLLRGRISDHESLATMLDRADIHIDSVLYVVVLIKIGHEPEVEDQMLLDEIDRYREELQETVRRIFDGVCLFHDLSEETTLVLVGTELTDEEGFVTRITEWIERCFDQLPGARPAPVVFAVGEPFRDLLGAHGSCEQALEALGYAEEGDRVVCFSSVGRANDEYYYPLELESRLLGAIQSGDRAGVEQALSTVWENNHGTRALRLETRRALLNELYGTLHKLRTQKRLNGSLQTIERALAGGAELTVGAAFTHLRDHMLAICDEIRERRRTRTCELAHSISTFLGEHYDDPQLSLCSTAEQFSLTEAYVSAFFKEQIGSNFSRYVENLRLESASRYLSETNLPIKSIARKVGYNSDKAFRRAFKRVHGVSPADFRLQERPIALRQ